MLFLMELPSNAADAFGMDFTESQFQADRDVVCVDGLRAAWDFLLPTTGNRAVAKSLPKKPTL
jgi:hypothetical protein